MDYADEAPLANTNIECLKWSEKSRILWRSGTQYVAMVTKIVTSYCKTPLVESYCKNQTFLINIGTQSVQELFFCDRSIRRTVYSNDFV